MRRGGNATKNQQNRDALCQVLPGLKPVTHTVGVERPIQESSIQIAIEIVRAQPRVATLLVGFYEFAEELGGVFAKFAVVGAESGEEVAVDVEFADDFSFCKNGDDDF